MGEQKQDYEGINIELYALYKKTNNNEYLEQLYNMNLGLFRKVCYKFPQEEQGDLLQECYFALIKAVETYQEDSGEFGTYLAHIATWHLLRYLKANRLVHIPEYMQALIKKYLSLKNSDQETDTEICVLLDIGPEELQEIKTTLNVYKISSLDVPVDEDQGEKTRCDLIADQGESIEQSAIDNVFQEELKQALAEELEKLTPVEKSFIELRFYEGLAYKEIDPDHSPYYTSERIEKALQKLRKNKRLESFYEDTNVLIGSGLNYWKNHHTSAVERAVFNKYKVEDFYNDTD